MPIGELDQGQVYTSGTTLTVTDGVGVLFLDPTSAIAALTITMPANPSDGQRLRIVPGGTVNSGTVITLLTISANTGQSLVGVGGAAVFSAGTSMILMYRTAIAKWYRLE